MIFRYKIILIFGSKSSYQICCAMLNAFIWLHIIIIKEGQITPLWSHGYTWGCLLYAIISNTGVVKNGRSCHKLHIKNTNYLNIIKIEKKKLWKPLFIMYYCSCSIFHIKK